MTETEKIQLVNEEIHELVEESIITCMTYEDKRGALDWLRLKLKLMEMEYE